MTQLWRMATLHVFYCGSNSLNVKFNFLFWTFVQSDLSLPCSPNAKGLLESRPLAPKYGANEVSSWLCTHEFLRRWRNFLVPFASLWSSQLCNEAPRKLWDVCLIMTGITKWSIWKKRYHRIFCVHHVRLRLSWDWSLSFAVRKWSKAAWAITHFNCTLLMQLKRQEVSNILCSEVGIRIADFATLTEEMCIILLVFTDSFSSLLLYCYYILRWLTVVMLSRCKFFHV
jgi:hypothetical protein